MPIKETDLQIARDTFNKINDELEKFLSALKHSCLSYNDLDEKLKLIHRELNWDVDSSEKLKDTLPVLTHLLRIKIEKEKGNSPIVNYPKR